MPVEPVCVRRVNDPADKRRADMFSFLAAGGTPRGEGRASMTENTLREHCGGASDAGIGVLVCFNYPAAGRMLRITLNTR